jgi:4-hydroxyphenylacetate 3-monooxygenase
VKLEFLCGLLVKAVEITGTSDFRGIQAAIGEAISLRHTMLSLSDSMVHAGETWAGDYYKPNYAACLAYRNLYVDAYCRISFQILTLLYRAQSHCQPQRP